MEPSLNNTFHKSSLDVTADPLSSGDSNHGDENILAWVLIDVILMTVIVSGNVLTILAVNLNRALSSVISNQFILSLAVSDLLVGLLLPYHLMFYTGTSLNEYKSTCLARFVFISMACCLSIYNLLSVALDRYIAIVYPLHYGMYMTKKVAATIIASGWLTALVYGVLPVFWTKWDKTKECEMHEVVPGWYVTNVLTPTIGTTWVAMLAVYFRIWREAAGHAKRLRNTSFNGNQNNDWKSVQLVLLVLGSFSLTWLPYLTVICAQAFRLLIDEKDALIYRITFSLAMSNSGINPMIYAWKNSRFRKAFIRLLHCKSPQRPTYDPSLRNKNPTLNNSKHPSFDDIVGQKDTDKPCDDETATPKAMTPTVKHQVSAASRESYDSGVLCNDQPDDKSQEHQTDRQNMGDYVTSINMDQVILKRNYVIERMNDKKPQEMADQQKEEMENGKEIIIHL